MSTGLPLVLPLQQFFDNNGEPLANGTLEVYQAGTGTPLATYFDSALTIANPNPIPLDAAGRCVAFVPAVGYKIRILDSIGQVMGTSDNIFPLGEGTTQDVALTGSQAVVLNQGVTAIRFTNPTLLSVSTITPPATVRDGDLLVGFSFGAGQVDIPNSATVETGLTITRSLTPQLGSFIAVWNNATMKWRIIQHEQGAFISYPVTWGNTGTANTLGNGTLTGAYKIEGRAISYVVAVGWGSTTASGNGRQQFLMPFNSNGAGIDGSIVSYDSSADTAYVGFATSANVGTINCYSHNTTGITVAVPFVWATNDVLRVSGLYSLP